jgi:hypothetical protein
MTILTGLLWGQALPLRFSLDKAFLDDGQSYWVDSTSYEGLASNSIIDIRTASDSILFFGTSRGLSLTPDRGSEFRSYVADKVDLPEGGISALDLYDSLVVVAGLVDTVISGTGEVMGAGLAFSRDLGNTWTYKDQPQDDVDSEEFISFSWAGHTLQQLAVTTAIRNVTYDVAVTPGTIWAASWASGLRRYELATRLWTPVPLPLDNDTTFSCTNIPEDYVLNTRDPGDGGNHNHKAFSVVAYDSVVWVGTAAGINRGIVEAATGCITWTHFKAQWGDHPISGNWVVALHRQITTEGKERIWAATVNAEQPGERRGVSFTEDSGQTWTTTLLDERAHNISSSGDAVYVATDKGLYKSFDGINWALFRSATDHLTGEQVWADQAYGALFDSRYATLWVGTPDGLAKTRDQGITWTIERSFVPAVAPEDERFYAYPNPFYLATDNFRDGRGHVRFQYHVEGYEINRTARISIYDFAMDPVVSLPSRQHPIAGDFSQVWDGRNEAGYQVANGVYYCRLTFGSEDFWTKVLVIK